MAVRRRALIVLGLLLVLFGTIFALQGANLFPGRSFMNGDPTYIYVGGVLAVIGLILVVVGTLSRSKASLTVTPTEGSQPR